MSQPVFNILKTDLYLSYISLLLEIEVEVELVIIGVAVKRDVISLQVFSQWECVDRKTVDLKVNPVEPYMKYMPVWRKICQ